jgi:hypothetical protein
MIMSLIQTGYSANVKTPSFKTNMSVVFCKLPGGSKRVITTLSGSVKNTEGCALEGVAVELLNSDCRTVTNKLGNYIISIVATGSVTLKFSYKGKPSAEMEIFIPKYDEDMEITVTEMIINTNNRKNTNRLK